jgi:hypothetical protein
MTKSLNGINQRLDNASLNQLRVERLVTRRNKITINQSTAYSYTSLELMNSIIVRSGMTAAVNDPFPSAAQFVSQLGLNTGDGFKFVALINNSGSGGVWAPLLGTGGNAISFTSVAASTKAVAEYGITITNDAPGAESYDIVRISYFTGATTFA